MPGLPIPGYPQLQMGHPAGAALRARWRKERPDLVHVVTEGPLGVSAIRAARRLGIPVTSSFHTHFHAYTRHYGLGLLRPLALAWLRYVHNRTARTFAPTAQLCAELESQGFERLLVLSRGIDTARFTPAKRCEKLRSTWGARPDDPVVLHVGRMAPEKNYELLFQAYAWMRSVNSRCRFVLVGDGPLRPTLAREHYTCVFPGFVSREELARHYASADLYLHASLTETYGNVFAEAMASGLAVAGFDYAAAREFAQHERNALLAAVDQPRELIAAGVRLAVDGELRTRLRESARAAVLDRTWSHVADRFEADLMAVVSACPLPHATQSAYA